MNSSGVAASANPSAWCRPSGSSRATRPVSVIGLISTYLLPRSDLPKVLRNTYDLHVVADAQDALATLRRPRVDRQSVKMIEPIGRRPRGQRLLPMPRKYFGKLTGRFSRPWISRRHDTTLTRVSAPEFGRADAKPHDLALAGHQ